MRPTQKQTGASSVGPAGHVAQAGAGPFMLTLCRLAAPVSVRAPQAPHLKPFTFFMSRSRQADGAERLHLHMGYFPTLEQAQKWAQLMRGAYPQATPTRAPPAFLQRHNSGVPTLSPVDDKSLTDTQVFRILETRRATPGEDSTGEKNSTEISLIRPDDTDTRRVLKEAVVQGAPVSFAVQLHWSVQPIDLASVPSLSIFRAYTLYASHGNRDGRSWHCLRLGFFSDAISAKQVAYYVRSNFASVAVVPVSEQERTRATETRIDPSALGNPLRQSIDQALERDRAPVKPGSAAPAPTRPSESPAKSQAAPARPAATPTSHKDETLEQTLELLAASEMWSDTDSLSETGVRHLKFDVQKRSSKRS